MPTAQKAATIKALSDQLTRAQLTIVTDYRGLGVAELQGLRGNLRPTGAEFRIAKNTLTTIAAERAGIDGLAGLLAGPTALVLAYDDPVQASKVVSDFVRTSRVLTVRGGVMNNQLVTAPDIDNPIHVGGMASEVDRNHGTCARGDRLLNVLGRDIQRLPLDVGENR